MRAAFAVVVASLLALFAGCHKGHTLCCEPPIYFPDSGNWRMVQFSSGIAGIIKPVPPDSVVLLTLSAQWSYKATVNGRTTDSGRFGLTDVPPGAMPGTLGVKFSGDSSMVYLLWANQDSLLLTQLITYGSEFTYLKQH
jgi:hypothetical protein